MYLSVYIPITILNQDNHCFRRTPGGIGRQSPLRTPSQVCLKLYFIRKMYLSVYHKIDFAILLSLYLTKTTTVSGARQGASGDNLLYARRHRYVLCFVLRGRCTFLFTTKLTLLYCYHFTQLRQPLLVSDDISMACCYCFVLKLTVYICT